MYVTRLMYFLFIQICYSKDIFFSSFLFHAFAITCWSKHMLPKGTILGHYRLLQRIGVGGMGEVLF